jgi:Sec-independent protein translocase protein TatA
MKKFKKRVSSFKQYTDDNIRKKRLKTESRHNVKAKIDSATVNEEWDDLYEESKESAHNR